MSDPENDLTTALRDRVADEHPDFVRLTAGAIGEGARIRRRRRITASLGATAAVGAFAAGGLGLSQLLATPTAVDQAPIGAAGAPSASAAALTPGQNLDLGKGVTGLVVTAAEAKTMDITTQTESRSPGTGTGFTIVLSGPPDAVDQVWSGGTLVEDYPGIKIATAGAPHGLVDTEPVKAPAGWTCEWYLVDDKASCSSTDGGVATLVIRPAADYQEWSTSSDKAGPGSGSYLTQVHGDVFISVQSGQGTTDAELESLAGSLEWVG